MRSKVTLTPKRAVRMSMVSDFCKYRDNRMYLLAQVNGISHKIHIG